MQGLSSIGLMPKYWGGDILMVQISAFQGQNIDDLLEANNYACCQEKVPANNAVSQYAEALAKACSEYNNPRDVIMIVVQAEERNMYDQHFLSAILRDKYPYLHR
ncbi:hypothetical protein TSUD_144840 [Trifolium subterraneum]|uniref:Uncharacterized protein n=1 Tax=Trifolium subterraneum TaxID=3900 RepID=A0A2Z6N480_TRISU|nr:hypothetical protein TSUD_144840 [Trifolium subterraneum]